MPTLRQEDPAMKISRKNMESTFSGPTYGLSKVATAEPVPFVSKQLHDRRPRQLYGQSTPNLGESFVAPSHT